MTAPSFEDTLVELNALSQFFITTESALKNGQSVDMSGIDARITALCLIVQQAEAEQQEVYLPQLTALLGLLNSCELALRVMQTTIELEHDTNEINKDRDHAND